LHEGFSSPSLKLLPVNFQSPQLRLAVRSESPQTTLGLAPSMFMGESTPVPWSKAETHLRNPSARSNYLWHSNSLIYIVLGIGSLLSTTCRPQRRLRYIYIHEVRTLQAMFRLKLPAPDTTRGPRSAISPLVGGLISFLSAVPAFISPAVLRVATPILVVMSVSLVQPRISAGVAVNPVLTRAVSLPSIVALSVPFAPTFKFLSPSPSVWTSLSSSVFVPSSLSILF